MTDLAGLCPRLGGNRALVVGDVMLDRFIYGSVARISPEAPVPVVSVRRQAEMLGGAGNVLRNLVALGLRAGAIAVIGADDAGRTIRQLMAEMREAEPQLLVDPCRRTTVKERFVVAGQQLLRADRETPHRLPSALADALVAMTRTALDKASVLIVSDYAKGLLCTEVLQRLIAQSRERRLPVIIDPKGRDFGRYRGATVLTPNLAELEAVAGRCSSEAQIAERGHRLQRELNLDALLVTRGEQGMLLLQEGQEPLVLAAEAREVFDVTGAGDTVVATLAAALAAGHGLHDACRLANAAAGIAVGKVGTATVSAGELQTVLSRRPLDVSGVLDEQELTTQVIASRRREKTLVLTYGCFDELHAGHVAFLQAARRRGDVLVVAVADDASVRRTKGPGFPRNCLADRVRVLASLKCVDWVVSYAEHTPARVIARVLPDVLLKAGDYQAEDLAGYETVRAEGGEVVVIDRVPGYAAAAQSVAASS